MKVQQEGTESGSQVAMTLAEIAQRLERMDVRWAVFAGAAATVYGVSRPITDVDILVAAADGERVAAGFPEGEVKRYEDGTLGIALPGFDLVALRGSIELDSEMAGRVRRHKILGVEVPVVPPEDNILFKGLLGRGAEVGKHDWADVEAMIRHLPAVDWDYLEGRVAVMESTSTAQTVLGRVRWLWERRDSAGMPVSDGKERTDGQD